MPFDLIPPEKKKKKESLIGVLSLKKTKDPKKFLYFGIFLGGVVLVFLLYFIVKTYKASLQHKIVSLNEQINETNKEKALLRKDSEVSDFQTRLNLLSGLAEQHAYWSHLFALIEGITLPKVQFTNFTADQKAKTLNLNGITTDFTRLAEQMVALKSEDWVTSLKLTSLSISKEGIKFHFNLNVSPQVWKAQKNNNDITS